ncbi:hypothetical protein F4811DRAFT_534109 [Daldinia bambusicola]|nr:hypothetical protein F4811DRAFT_534109 [Daldinia bambusicola]
MGEELILFLKIVIFISWLWIISWCLSRVNYLSTPALHNVYTSSPTKRGTRMEGVTTMMYPVWPVCPAADYPPIKADLSLTLHAE